MANKAQCLHYAISFPRYNRTRQVQSPQEKLKKAYTLSSFLWPQKTGPTNVKKDMKSRMSQTKIQKIQKKSIGDSIISLDFFQIKAILNFCLNSKFFRQVIKGNASSIFYFRYSVNQCSKSHRTDKFFCSHTVRKQFSKNDEKTQKMK